ncbi:hypothetical protein F7725_011114 [Dissostichus mawsoni]|uniref:Uncharacterized protein n=1 Tax=Dissostichus mawsoni TaxID=36200 RepID=A0A7J5Z8N2_DISMA|nr:hypothetical protein F7725_011114 [Dissostichus mawsoni]
MPQRTFQHRHSESQPAALGAVSWSRILNRVSQWPVFTDTDSVRERTYLTHEAKGSDDAPDADTAIINAEGGHSGAEDKKEYFI